MFRTMSSSAIFSRYLLFALVLFTTQISALTLLELLKATPELSTLYNRINASTYLTGFLQNSSDFTLLAPSNDAFIKGSGSGNMTDDQFTAFVQYSMLRGAFSKLSLGTDRQFVNSNLNNSNFANVTGGQAVGLGIGGKGQVEVLSGNGTVSESSKNIVCVGGLLHIVDELVTIPLSAVLEITAAGLEYFIAILAKGNYLTTGRSYVDPVVYEPNITFFIPNSPDALANFNILQKTATPSDLQNNFLYHVVPNFVGYSPMLTDGLSLKTQMGSNLTIHVQDGQTYVNGAKVLKTDYLIANGVIHVIDSILNSTNTTGPPPSTSANKNTPTTIATEPSSTAPVSAQTSTSAPVSSAASKSPLGTGAIIGVAIGGVALLVLLSALIFFCLRSRKSTRRRTSTANTPMEGLTYEGPTGEPLYANRYRMTKEVGSGRYKVERDSGASQWDVSPLSGGSSVAGGQGSGMSVMPLRVDTKGANNGRAVMPPSTHANERPSIPQRSPSRGVISGKGGGMF